MALCDPAWEVRATAAAALRRLGRQAEEVAPALLITLKDEMPELRVLSATALGKVAPGDGKAIEALGRAALTVTSTSTSGAAVLASGLGWMGPKRGRGPGLDPGLRTTVMGQSGFKALSWRLDGLGRRTSPSRRS